MKSPPHRRTRIVGLRVSVGLGLSLLVLSSADWVHAQEPPRRSGADRQLVVQLAYTLGEAHALHRLCTGPGDATWYARMQRLEGQEAADEAARAQLVESFNAGFAARQAQFVGCSRRSRATERAVAQRGSALAQRLAATEDPRP